MSYRFTLGIIAAFLLVGYVVTAYFTSQKKTSENVSLFDDINKTLSAPIYENAIKQIQNNKAAALIIKNNQIIAQATGKGILPILKLHDNQVLKGGSLIDKVIGRAAAFIAIDGNVQTVYGEMMSEDALQLLKNHKIPATYGKLVPQILNRDKSGLCPMEQTVLGIQSPDEALKLLRKKLKELK